MKSQNKPKIPLRAKIATVICGVVAILAIAFSVYAGMPDTKIPDPDNNLWGVLVLVVLFGCLLIMYWGWKSVFKDE